MTIPILVPPLRTYYSPNLWIRLEGKIREQILDKTQHLVDAKWKTLDEAREYVGYLRALEWVFAMADNLTRQEDIEE